jgi:hypothetical protein
MDYLEAVEDYLEAESIVTVNWLANEMNIPLVKAIELLDSYVATRKEIKKYYLLIGYDIEDHLKFQIVSDKTSSSEIQRVICKQIFSIHKQTEGGNHHSSMIHSVLQQSESLFLQDQLLKDRNSFLYNGMGKVINRKVKVKSFGERVISEQNLQYKRSLSNQPVIPSIQSFGDKFKKPVSEASSVPVHVADQAKSFFDKPSAPAVVAKSPSVPATIISVSQTKPKGDEESFKPMSGEKRKLQKHVSAASSDSDEEWDLDVTDSKKAKVELSTESVVTAEVKKEVVTEENEESGEEEEQVEGGENKENVEKKPRKKRTTSSQKKTNIHVHGAMDNFMEDAAINKFKIEEENSHGDAIPVRKMKKVLVEKVYYV